MASLAMPATLSLSLKCLCHMQKTVAAKARPFIRSTITELFSRTLPQCLTIADLGCSSSPNSFCTILDIIHTVSALRSKTDYTAHEFQVYLNDLPANDFNTLFNFIPKFQKEGNNMGPIFVAGVPGTFYGRLFPAKSLFFVHSCYSVHWLSQIPKGIETNKGNIYLSKTSPPCVLEAYLNQFEKDFGSFLQSRSEEMILGGRMVLILKGRRSADPSSKECCRIWELLAKSLGDMAAQGLVQEEKLHSFHMPNYFPNDTELRRIIEMEGSFHLDSLESFDTNWDANDDPDNKDFVFDEIKSGQDAANVIRAVTEPLLVRHFGEDMISDLFERFTKYVRKQLVSEKLRTLVW